MTNELKVINSVLKNGDIGTIFESNVDALFTSYGDVWGFIKKYYSEHRAVPDITLVQEKFGKNEVQDIPVKGATDYYLDALRKDYTRTRLASLLDNGSRGLYAHEPEVLLKKLMEEFYTLADRTGTARDLNIMDFDDAERHYAEVRAKVLARGGTPGIPTGVKFIDAAYPSGLAGGDLIIVLGWTGRAKSYWTTYLCCNAFQYGYHPMIISLEMGEEKVRDRAYTLLGNGTFKNSDLSMGQIDMDNFKSFGKQHTGKGAFTIIANNGGNEITPNLVQAKINQHKPDIIVLDYAQLMSDNEDSGDMVGRMRNLSKQLKAMAVANDIPIILISSATPDNPKAAETPPTIEQVAWSKQLAFDADLAVAVHKHDNSNHVEIVGRKNRNGDLFRGILDWDIDSGVVKESFDSEEVGF